MTTFDPVQYEDDLDSKHQKLQNDLQELQVIETYLFDELRSIDGSSQDSVSRKQEINKRIDSLKSVRSTLLQNLKNLYTNVTGEISYNTRHLENQRDMSSHINRELNKANQQLKKLKAEKNNKTRLAQVGEYEYEKNIEHRSILKTIVYASFFVLIFTFLNFKNVLPNMVTKVFIIVTVSIALLLLIQRFFWNFRRDNIDYSKFKQLDYIPGVVPEKKVNTLSVRKILGLQCDEPDLQQLAQDKANERNRRGNIDGFSNFFDVFPRQTSCVKNKCKQNKNESKNLSFSLI